MRIPLLQSAPTNSEAEASLPKRLLSSWSIWGGLVLLALILVFWPWQQEFLWNDGDVVFPVKALHYRMFWDPPAEARVDVIRLVSEVVVLALLVAVVFRFEQYHRRPSWRPRQKGMPYSEADWTAEISERERGGPYPCPACQRRGFYGPRSDESGRRYRLCNFCGFMQNAGEAYIDMRPCIHNCGKVSTIAGAPYVTWVRPEQTSYLCEFCGENTDLADSLDSSPALDQHHPWWAVPQEFSRPEFVRFWLNNGAPGQVYL